MVVELLMVVVVGNRGYEYEYEYDGREGLKWWRMGRDEFK